MVTQAIVALAQADIVVSQAIADIQVLLVQVEQSGIVVHFVIQQTKLQQSIHQLQLLLILMI